MFTFDKEVNGKFLYRMVDGATCAEVAARLSSLGVTGKWISDETSTCYNQFCSCGVPMSTNSRLVLEAALPVTKSKQHSVKSKRWRPTPGGTVPAGLIFFKAAKYEGSGVVVKLEALEDGIVPIGQRMRGKDGTTITKFRVPSAKVLSIKTFNNQDVPSADSFHDPRYKYYPGTIARPQFPFNPDVTEDCGSGINGMRTAKEARNYVY